MGDINHIAGLIAGGVHPSPVGYAHIITSTTHKTLRGGRGGIIMTNDPEISKKVDRWVFPGYQGIHYFTQLQEKLIGFYETLTPMFKKYATDIVKNSQIFCNKFKELGAKIISGGTDNHLFMINVLQTYNITGKQAEDLLHKINITVNKNSIPFDTLSPNEGSGIRLGAAAMTSRDFDKWEQLALIIHRLLSNYHKIQNDKFFDKQIINDLKKEVKEITKNYPIKKSYLNETN